jgi:hypothetical protein
MSANYPDRPTFSQRHGRGRRSVPLPFEQFRNLVARILADEFRRDRLQEAFGYECVDSGTVAGSLGSDPDVFFERRLGFPVMPPERTVLEMDRDELFDFIEVLHDIVSVGDEEAGSYHGYSDCGWHFREFSQQPAQAELREALNPLMGRLEPPLLLNEEGYVLEMAPHDLQPLLEAALPAESPHDEVRSRVETAVARYRRSRGDLEERRAAVRDLADVLEFLRDRVRLAMLPADEAALFTIANKFAIRHHNRAQRGDYDKETWLSWAFYLYLATIHALERVVARQAQKDKG